MSITDEYNRQLQQKQFQADAEQQKIVQQLQDLQQSLAHQYAQSQTFGYRLKSWLRLTPLSNAPALRGCYIWGDVGRGKTWLMDMFYDSFDSPGFSTEQKIRLHFNHFMQFIHDQLSLPKQQPDRQSSKQPRKQPRKQQNPLRQIALAFAGRYRLLCIDEFHVSDITDAMLLSGLLEALFEEGLILVATSNQPPDELYKNGLQRERFLPAIALIKEHTQTLRLDGATDHRLRILEKADIWHPLNARSDEALEQRFLALTSAPVQKNHKIHINYRSIKTRFCSSGIIWFDFQIICGDQRASTDYIHIAQQFHSVFISGIQKMNDGQNDKARRFIHMIDEFYDRNVNLLCSAADQPDALYSGKQLSFEFKRTASRLEEMRSHNYMQRPHKP